MASAPSVLVVGGGRVGTYVACKFKSAGTTGEVVLKGSPASRGVSSLQPFVDAMCAETGVTFVRDYEAHRDRVFDFVFVSVKTYDLPSVKAELDAHGITPKTAILVHNGIVGPLFANAVRVVIPQSYDFVEEAVEEAETQLASHRKKRITIHVKNEEKPWVMPDTDAARAVASLLEASDMRAVADPAFPYGLIRKFFINGVANLLAIVGDCDCNGLLKNHRERMERLYEEFVLVLAAPHADAFAMLPPDFHSVVFDGLASYGEHFPSTKMDFDAGRALEVDSLNGYVVAQARRQGVPAPENEKLVDEVAKMVAARDEPR
jgi:2-dehydropantoate 2-reductase